MKHRTILTLTLMLTVAAACGEGREHEDRADDEAAEAAEHGEPGGAGMIELPADLMARAAVTVEAARASALARVPGGQLVAGELEEEDGKLIYSFDIRVAGQEGIEEVHVDALTGEVIAQEHEGEAEEAGERGGEG
jgi:uncharacterized membrane protein YkoI